MAATILTGSFLLIYGLLIFYYFTWWNKIERWHPSSQFSPVFVSVIIAARNEEHSLPLLVKDLEHQTYPADLFEVIIVNDHSTDGTASIADRLPKNMRMILPAAGAEASSKKIAIATGIQQARGEWIMITDADCRVNAKWLEAVAGFYKEKNAALIAAPVKFTCDRSMLEVFQALDFITLQGITAASVSAGFHAMCNGANLAYTKKAFESVNGFEGIDKVATGDDMLLMHKIAKKHPGRIYYLKTEDAIVTTAPAKTWKEFFMQRKRWASKTLVYDDVRIILVLMFVLLFNLLFFVWLIAMFFNKIYGLHLLVLLLGKTIIEWPFVSSVSSFYGEQKWMRYFFFIQPLHLFYTVSVGLLSQFGKYEWKGRRTK